VDVGDAMLQCDSPLRKHNIFTSRPSRAEVQSQIAVNVGSTLRKISARHLAFHFRHQFFASSRHPGEGRDLIRPAVCRILDAWTDPRLRVDDV
jgi:hypothetical protein